jgi:hypothetical protein
MNPTKEQWDECIAKSREHLLQMSAEKHLHSCYDRPLEIAEGFVLTDKHYEIIEYMVRTYDRYTGSYYSYGYAERDGLVEAFYDMSGFGAKCPLFSAHFQYADWYEEGHPSGWSFLHSFWYTSHYLKEAARLLEERNAT